MGTILKTYEAFSTLVNRLAPYLKEHREIHDLAMRTLEKTAKESLSSLIEGLTVGNIIHESWESPYRELNTLKYMSWFGTYEDQEVIIRLSLEHLQKTGSIDIFEREGAKDAVKKVKKIYGDEENHARYLNGPIEVAVTPLKKYALKSANQST